MKDIRSVLWDIERCCCHVPDACRDCSHYTGTVGFSCMENLMMDAYRLLLEQVKKDRLSSVYGVQGGSNNGKTV